MGNQPNVCCRDNIARYKQTRRLLKCVDDHCLVKVMEGLWGEVLCGTLISPARTGSWGIWSSRKALYGVTMKWWNLRSLGQCLPILPTPTPGKVMKQLIPDIIYKHVEKKMGREMDSEGIENWLNDRSQRAVVSDMESSWRPVATSVPWHSVLHPVLFHLFIKSMDKRTERTLSRWYRTGRSG